MTTTLRPVTVLIADDSPLIRERLVALLERQAGVEIVGEAADAPGTIAALRRWSPDVLLLDWRMPGGGASRVLGALRADALQPKVIVLTNHADEMYRTHALGLGAHYLLDKANEFCRIRSLIRDLGQPVAVR